MRDAQVAVPLFNLPHRHWCAALTWQLVCWIPTWKETVAREVRGNHLVLLGVVHPRSQTVPSFSEDGSWGSHHHLQAFYDHFQMQILPAESPPRSDSYQPFRGHQLLPPVSYSFRLCFICFYHHRSLMLPFTFEDACLIHLHFKTTLRITFSPSLF